MTEFDTVIRNGVVVTAAFLHHLLLATTIASALVVVESWPKLQAVDDRPGGRS